jgi:flagellar motility protein MotE (MotC chaperone)
MTRLLRDVRLIPIVLVATISLFALKVSGLVFDGGYTLAERMDHNKNDLKIVPADSVPDFPKIVMADTPQAPGQKQPWAKEMFNFGGSGSDITGSVDKAAEKPAEKDKKAEGEKKPEADKKAEGEKKDDKGAPSLPVSNKAPGPTKVDVGDVSVQIEQGHIASAGERAVLERLRDRNQELDARARELDMRENLIKAAEKRLEAKVAELKDTETKVNTAIGTRDKQEAARFNGIVSMYENMKPKDAARIFGRLELNILVDVSTKINPRKMSDILAQMSPDAAERLTVELAHRAGAVQKTQGVDQLPKIEGKPVQP